jgi:hypothetical protein
VIPTELVDHITHGDTKEAIEQFYDATAITAAVDTWLRRVGLVGGG